MKKEEVKVLIAIIAVMALFVGSKIYKNNLENKKYKELKTENSVAKVLCEKKDEIDISLLDKCNSFIDSFRGVERVYIRKEKVKTEANVNIYNYIDIYNKENGLKEKSNYKHKSEVFKEIYEKNKYYNEEELELFLILYNHDERSSLSVEDIKKFIDESNKGDIKKIDDYVSWYRVRGKELYTRYYEYYNILSSKYNYKDFDLTSIEEKKEILNKFIKDGMPMPKKAEEDLEKQ